MIIVSLHAQMGNQMFQYAFAKAISKRLHTFYLPFQSNYYYPFKLGYFTLDWFTRFVFSSPKITKQYNRICRKLIKYALKKKVAGDDWKLTTDFPNNGYYYGFFQCETYFSIIDPNIKKCFEVRREYKAEFDRKYRDFLKSNKTIVVHVRRTDYKEVEFEGLGGQGVDLPLAYYEKALANIPDIADYKVLFISDDINSTKHDFISIKGATFEQNSAIIDFQLIQHADIAIIANSTFAWWAAYLSKKESSVIYAPKYWLGFKVKKEYPVGIATPKFQWVDF